jgi:predicted secreted protein
MRMSLLWLGVIALSAIQLCAAAPVDVTARVSEAIALAKAGKTDDAMVMLDDLSKTAGLDPLLSLGYGMVYGQSGSNFSAARSIEELQLFLDNQVGFSEEYKQTVNGFIETLKQGRTITDGVPAERKPDLARRSGAPVMPSASDKLLRFNFENQEYIACGVTNDGRTKIITASYAPFSNDGQIVVVAGVARVLISLGGNPTTGYQWKIGRIVGAAVQADGEGHYLGSEASPGMCGEGGTFVACFRVKAKGIATVTMEYRRPGETNMPGVRTFTVSLDVQDVPAVPVAGMAE